MTAHPTDPPMLHRAAQGFGRMRAQGLLGHAEIVRALGDAAPSAGTRMRVTHSYMDSTAHHARLRHQARRLVREAVLPALAAWREAPVILAIADAHDSAALAPGEARAIAASEAARQLRRRR